MTGPCATSIIDTAKRYSVIGLGTWQFGSREWGYGADYDEGEAARIVARARELGVTVFDTAEIYGFGRSERILGAALRAGGGTDDVVVASKVFPVMPTAAVVQQRGVASAQRLGRAEDRPLPGAPAQPGGPRPAPRCAACARCATSGSSTRSACPTTRCAAGSAARSSWRGRVLSNQVQFSLVSRAPLAEMLPWAQRTRHVVMAYSPLAQGLLSGRYYARPPARTAGPGRQRHVPAGEPARRRPVAPAAARGGRRPRRDPGADRAGLAGALPERGRDPRGVERGAGGEQRGRRRHRAERATSTARSPRPRRRSTRRPGSRAIPALVRGRAADARTPALAPAPRREPISRGARAGTPACGATPASPAPRRRCPGGSRR